MDILAGKSKGIHNFVNHDKYKGYGCTRTHEFAKETRNVEGETAATASSSLCPEPQKEERIR